jgi:hypothetical protein
LYLRLLAQSDDNANYFGNPALILGYLFAHRLALSQVTVEDIEKRLDELERAGVELVHRYTVNDRQYVHLPGCFRHIRRDVQPDVRFPVAPGADDLRNACGPRAGRKRNGRGPIDQTIPDQTIPDQTTVSGTALELARHLHDRIVANYPTSHEASHEGNGLKAHLASWAKTFDVMLRKHDKDKLLKAIDAAQGDNVPRNGDFCWAKVVRSPDKVLKHLDKLLDLGVPKAQESAYPVLTRRRC